MHVNSRFSPSQHNLQPPIRAPHLHGTWKPSCSRSFCATALADLFLLTSNQAATSRKATSAPTFFLHLPALWSWRPFPRSPTDLTTASPPPLSPACVPPRASRCCLSFAGFEQPRKAEPGVWQTSPNDPRRPSIGDYDLYTRCACDFDGVTISEIHGVSESSLPFTTLDPAKSFENHLRIPKLAPPHALRTSKLPTRRGPA